MHLRFPLLLILLSLSIPSLGETWGDLVEREGLFYKKFTDVPFTGEVEGKKRQGSVKMESWTALGCGITIMDSYRSKADIRTASKKVRGCGITITDSQKRKVTTRTA